MKCSEFLIGIKNYRLSGVMRGRDRKQELSYDNGIVTCIEIIPFGSTVEGATAATANREKNGGGDKIANVR